MPCNSNSTLRGLPAVPCAYKRSCRAASRSPNSTSPSSASDLDFGPIGAESVGIWVMSTLPAGAANAMCGPVPSSVPEFFLAMAHPSTSHPVACGETVADVPFDARISCRMGYSS